jgi:RNA polymerase sigma-70 factor (ECF subfamily)
MSNLSLKRMSRIASSSTQETESVLPSIEELVHTHYAYVRRLAFSILDDPHEADDAAQETFIAANRALPGFRGDSRLRTWLTTITVNTCRGRLRRRKNHQRLQQILQAVHLVQRATIEEATIQKDAQSDLCAAVARLDEKHRLPVLLHYVQELSVPEIAAVLGVNQGTIYSRLYYARRMLLVQLDSTNPHEEASDESHSTPVA